MSGRKVAGAIRPLFNAMSLHLEFAKVLHEGLLVTILLCGRDNHMERKGEF